MPKYIKLDKKSIDKLFNDTKKNEIEIIIDLYKIAFPNWDNIKSIPKWPSISKETNLYIFGKFIDFNKGTPKSALMWMNKGFSSDENMKSWVIDLSTATVIYNELKQAA